MDALIRMVGDLLRDNVTMSVCLLSTLVLIFVYRRWSRGFENLPPGPKPLPLVGNLHLFLFAHVQCVFRNLAKTYGDVYTFHFGPWKVIVLNSVEANKEAKAMKEFAGRPDLGSDDGTAYHGQPSNAGIIDAEGSIWKSNRKLCLRHLSQMGFGKRSFEPSIMKEVGYLLKIIEEKNGEAFVIDIPLANAVSNLICQMIFGQRYDYKDPEFAELLKSIESMAAGLPLLSILLPGSSYIPFVRNPILKYLAAFRHIDAVAAKHIENHRSPNEEPATDDLIHGFLRYKEEMSAGDSSKVDSRIFEDVYIRRTLFDMFLAGTETTTSTLRWMLAYLINFPDVQDKLRHEVHTVVGLDRSPSLSDKEDMPFTQAFIAEMQRIATLVPLSVPGRTMERVHYRGYTIPEDTVVLSHIAQVHMSEKYFPNPSVFRPERFLDADGKFRAALVDKTMPFGSGKRICLGMQVAKMEIFLFLTSMVQRFEFQCPAGEKMPSLENDLKTRDVNTPPVFPLCAVPCPNV